MTEYLKNEKKLNWNQEVPYDQHNSKSHTEKTFMRKQNADCGGSKALYAEN